MIRYFPPRGGPDRVPNAVHQTHQLDRFAVSPSGRRLSERALGLRVTFSVTAWRLCGGSKGLVLRYYHRRRPSERALGQAAQ